jgi:hypothetical protein
VIDGTPISLVSQVPFIGDVIEDHVAITKVGYAFMDEYTKVMPAESREIGKDQGT